MDSTLGYRSCCDGSSISGVLAIAVVQFSLRMLAWLTVLALTTLKRR